MKKRVLTFLFLMLSLFTSCSSSRPNLAPRTLEDYYISTGVEKYFLSDIPKWANFDQRAGCFRSTDIRYFNIEALMKSYNINYNNAIQIQATFNEEYWQLKQADKTRSPNLKDEELLFYKVSEKISNKLIYFEAPSFSRVNLVWLDEALNDEKKMAKLKNFLQSSAMDKGVPVLISFCMTREEVEKKFPDINTKMVTAELFSAYDSSGKLTPGFKIDLTQFFKPEQKIYFYSQQNVIPIDDVKGTYKILNY